MGATALRGGGAAETESDNSIDQRSVRADLCGRGRRRIWSMYTNRIGRCDRTRPDLRAPIQQMIDFMAARTAFFDEYFLATADAG